MRRAVAWWYSPESMRWVRWAARQGAWTSGDAMLAALQLSAAMPEGTTFVDVWRLKGSKWEHETRYRFEP